jgi:hypothetical protein
MRKVTQEAEVTIHGTATHGRTLVECSLCGPVAVTDASLDDALTQHQTEHADERSNR